MHIYSELRKDNITFLACTPHMQHFGGNLVFHMEFFKLHQMVVALKFPRSSKYNIAKRNNLKILV